MVDEPSRTRLNRLYWESDASVGEIADRLEISRRALYDGIEPRPAGAPCPDCGGELGFRNRTAAQNREATCADCGREVALEPGIPDPEDPEAEREAAAGRLSPIQALRAPTGSALAMGGALLAGLALGAVAGYFLRRR
jgi:hypothetical protein